ncbi:MAG: tetratricopeptide repeat protein [Bacteroidaceae bacterium]|nr:tetratricopeptide repeat protein [Bacteroidaceae bacterium]
MKKLFFAFLVLVAASASAQNGITNEFRFGQGEDSIRCLEAISITNINVKNKDFNTAYSSWKTVFTEFPVARVDTYTNGIKILTELIKAESDPAKKEEYTQELMLVYDNQIKYIDKLQEITKTPLSAGNLLGRKALAYMQYYKDAPVETVYKMLAEAVDMEKGKSEYTVTERFMKYSAMMFKKDKSHGEKIIEDYLNASVYIVEVLDKYHDNIEACNARYKEEGNPKDSINAEKYGKMIDASRISKSNIDAYFINSGAATCEDLNTIYLSKLEENKDNIEYLNKVISVMSMLKCTENDAYLIASEYALAIEPTSKAAMGCGFRYFKRGETDKAMELFDQAIELEASITTKAELCDKVGNVYYILGNYEKARAYALKALALNSKFGAPHILIAQCYAAKPQWCDDETLNACTYFLCIDRLERAKAVDPSVKKEADKYIAMYKKYYPKPEEMFMRGHSAGKSITIGGWINETTTIK